jgi:AcrR family transcriptional regulator
MTEPLGLRERKRLETRARLEEAAVSLAIDLGLENVTVDAISERADVSPRTFFNYFDSKEDAVLGLHEFELTDETMRQHAARYDGSDLVTSVVGLLFGLLGNTIVDGTMRARRMQVIKTHPQLLERHIVQMTRMSEKLTAAIETLARQKAVATAADASPDSTGESFAWTELLLSLCGGAVRSAVKEWVAAGSAEPTDLLEPRAVELVREVLEKLA